MKIIIECESSEIRDLEGLLLSFVKGILEDQKARVAKHVHDEHMRSLKVVTFGKEGPNAEVDIRHKCQEPPENIAARFNLPKRPWLAEKEADPRPGETELPANQPEYPPNITNENQERKAVSFQEMKDLVAHEKNTEAGNQRIEPIEPRGPSFQEMKDLVRPHLGKGAKEVAAILTAQGVNCTWLDVRTAQARIAHEKNNEAKNQRIAPIEDKVYQLFDERRTITEVIAILDSQGITADFKDVSFLQKRHAEKVRQSRPPLIKHRPGRPPVKKEDPAPVVEEEAWKHIKLEGTERPQVNDWIKKMHVAGADEKTIAGILSKLIGPYYTSKIVQMRLDYLLGR